MAHKVQPSLSNISLNHDSGASSLQEQLYFKILDLIENKSLRPGDPIPSSRKLASEIEVSRSTVVSVYNRLLEEGLLETKSGNGTFVSEISLGVFENRKESLPVNEKYLPSELPLSAQIAATATGFKVQKPMPFAVIAPDLDSLPGKNWTTVVARTSKSPWLHNGYCEPGGFMPYKKAVCDYLRQYRGLRCEPEQVITTNGTQQALDLCASVLFEKEDKIAVEDPYFQTHINLLEFRGLKPIPIPVSQDGIDIDKLKNKRNQRDTSNAMPSVPVRLRFFRRNNEKLLAWAKLEGIWIIEDDYDSELRYGKKPLPALSSYKDGDTVHLSRKLYQGNLSGLQYGLHGGP